MSRLNYDTLNVCPNFDTNRFVYFNCMPVNGLQNNLNLDQTQPNASPDMDTLSDALVMFLKYSLENVC